MKKTYPLTAFLFLALIISCSDKYEEPIRLCDSPVVPYFRYSWIDVEGQDLIFGKDAPYTMDDISFKSDYNGQVYSAEQMHLVVDSVSSDTTSVIMSWRGNGELSLGDLPPDRLVFTFATLSDEPCAGSQLAKLTVNDSTYCEPCVFQGPIVLRK